MGATELGLALDKEVQRGHCIDMAQQGFHTPDHAAGPIKCEPRGPTAEPSRLEVPDLQGLVRGGCVKLPSAEILWLGIQRLRV